MAFPFLFHGGSCAEFNGVSGSNRKEKKKEKKRQDSAFIFFAFYIDVSIQTFTVVFRSLLREAEVYFEAQSPQQTQNSLSRLALLFDKLALVFVTNMFYFNHTHTSIPALTVLIMALTKTNTHTHTYSASINLQN